MKYSTTLQDKVSETTNTTVKDYDVGWKKIFGADADYIDLEKTSSLQDEAVLTEEKTEYMPSNATIQYMGMPKEELYEDYRKDVVIDDDLDAQYKLSTIGKIVIAIYTAIMIGIFAIVVINTQTLKSMAYVIDTKQEKVYVLENEAEDLNKELEYAMSDEAIIERARELGYNV